MHNTRDRLCVNTQPSTWPHEPCAAMQCSPQAQPPWFCALGRLASESTKLSQQASCMQASNPTPSFRGLSAAVAPASIRGLLNLYLSQREVFLHSSTTERMFRFVMLTKFWNKIFVNMSLAPHQRNGGVNKQLSFVAQTMKHPITPQVLT